jgi:hypothetical protein
VNKDSCGKYRELAVGSWQWAVKMFEILESNAESILPTANHKQKTIDCQLSTANCELLTPSAQSLYLRLTYEGPQGY